jgi:hypothetical protein
MYFHSYIVAVIGGRVYGGVSCEDLDRQRHKSLSGPEEPGLNSIGKESDIQTHRRRHGVCEAGWLRLLEAPTPTPSGR